MTPIHRCPRWGSCSPRTCRRRPQTLNGQGAQGPHRLGQDHLHRLLDQNLHQRDPWVGITSTTTQAESTALEFTGTGSSASTPLGSGHGGSHLLDLVPAPGQQGEKGRTCPGELHRKGLTKFRRTSSTNLTKTTRILNEISFKNKNYSNRR